MFVVHEDWDRVIDYEYHGEESGELSESLSAIVLSDRS